MPLTLFSDREWWENVPRWPGYWPGKTWSWAMHGEEGRKPIVVLCVSRFPRALRSWGRSKQQGCILCKKWQDEAWIFAHLWCFGNQLSSSYCNCSCKEHLGQQQHQESQYGVSFRTFQYFSTIFSSLSFENSLRQQLQRKFSDKQQLCALVNNRGSGKVRQ